MPIITVKVKDSTFNHEPLFLVSTDKIDIVRNCQAGSNGDVQVNSGDIVMYTDKWVKNIHPDSKINIALIVECSEVNPDTLEYISTNNDKFDIVLTHNRKLVDRGENFKLSLFGTSWMADPYIRMWSKNKMCSLVTSAKQITTGHKLRFEVIDHMTKSGINYVDIFGANYNHIPFTTTRSFDKDHTARHVSNGKIRALKDYRFTIVIENCKEDYWLTEKLIDTFLTGTIPIYYGCPSIGDFFDVSGMLFFDTPEECISILNEKVNEDTFLSMKDAMLRNFETAKKFKSFNINEDAIIEKANDTI